MFTGGRRARRQARSGRFRGQGRVGHVESLEEVLPDTYVLYYIYIYIYIYIIFLCWGEVKPAQIQVYSSFISLGLVYPPPQPLISNRPWQCRSSAKGRHPVLKRYVGGGAYTLTKFSHSRIQSFRLVVRCYPIRAQTVRTLSILGPSGPLPQVTEGNTNTSCRPSGAQH